MPEIIGTPDGTITVTKTVVAATATAIATLTNSASALEIINNSPGVMDIGGSAIVPGGGIPILPNGGSLRLKFPADSPGTALTQIYAAYPGGSGDCRVIQLPTAMDLSRVFSPLQLSNFRTINAQVGTAYTLVLADSGMLITLTNAASIALTVPPNSSVAFPVNTEISLAQLGAGVVTVTAGGGVTIRSLGGLIALGGQYADARLKKIATDVWLLTGSLA